LREAPRCQHITAFGCGRDSSSSPLFHNSKRPLRLEEHATQLPSADEQGMRSMAESQLFAARQSSKAAYFAMAMAGLPFYDWLYWQIGKAAGLTPAALPS